MGSCAAVLAVVIEAGATVTQIGVAQFLRIRTLEPSVLAIIREGQRRSPTFAALVERVERSDTWVYIVRVHTLPHRMEGSLVHEHAYSATRYLKIALAMGTPSDRMIVVVAHELQHVREVLDAGISTDGEALDALYARIGTRQRGADAGEQYETAAAQDVENAVKRELSTRKRGEPQDRGDGQVPCALDEIPEAMVPASLRARRRRHAPIVAVHSRRSTPGCRRRVG